MKKVKLHDIVFILISAIVLSLAVYAGYSRIISQFSLLFILVAYFVGKYFGKAEHNDL